MSVEDTRLAQRIADLLPEIVEELKAMVAIPSVAFPTFPPEPVHRMADRAVAAFQRYGVPARLQEVPGGYPAVWAEMPAPPGRPTVLLYAHYDVQPAPKEQGWTTEPFEPTERDGRIYGRGAADDKSGIAIHLATLAAFGGKPPVGVRLVLEGEEETVSHLGPFVHAHPELFQADAMIIADTGNIVVGEPVLTTRLRGHVIANVEVRTLQHPIHSGMFGGAAPDALMALIKVLATLTDEQGGCAVPGIAAGRWEGADYSEDLFRVNAGVLDGVPLVGTGSIASRLWSKPSVSVLGIDAPSVKEAGNVLHASARALVAMRIPSAQDPAGAQAGLLDFLRAGVAPGVQVEVTPHKKSPAFAQSTDGPAFALMRAALELTYGKPVGLVGSGGSIPLLDALRAASPGADFVLCGAEDAQRSRIHGPDESVDPSEIERMALAQARLLVAMG
jgi:acetylornithine deacetylase/succinyl-diaminopimelate desuccinylase-like protein